MIRWLCQTSTHLSLCGPLAREKKKARDTLALLAGTASPAPLIDERILG